MRAWLWNFDADDELAAHEDYRGPAPAVAARFPALVRHVAKVMASGDVTVDPGRGPLAFAERYAATAFCPTPWALRQLATAGLRRPKAPSLSILAQVNHRAFAAAVASRFGAGCELPDVAFLGDEAGILAHVARRGPTGQWLLKRPHGFAGRGRRKVLAGGLSAADGAWVRAAVRRRGGLLVEPWVNVQVDAALHGWVTQQGVVSLGRPTVQRCDDQGAWQETIPDEGTLLAQEVDALRDAATCAAHALGDAGYFGPFNVDAFRYELDGASRFRALGELNARFSMGFGVGFGPPPAPGLE